jgi:Ca-activated chloride channel family protein
VRILPPRERPSAGSTLVEALVLDPEVRQVVFYLDGEVRARRRRLPWRTKLDLDDPPREQTVRVEALDLLERIVGSDEAVFNRRPRPLRVSIRAVQRAADEVTLRAAISTPEEVVLEGVDVFLNNELVDTLAPSALEEGQLETRFAAGAASESDFVRVVARLADGREVEDTQLVSGALFQEEIEVRLVELQVLVTDRQGRPLEGLRKEHFTIRDGGGPREPAGLFQADDVSLLLGYALDSSGSMAPIWQQTLMASRMFLDATLTARDAGFLVDFDWHIRLAQERTSDKPALEAALEGIEPEGGTALYDSVLYSLLQFDRQPGRRGLVVLTDGFDADSHADPERAVELARRLGVPVYVIALEPGGSSPFLPGPSPGSTSMHDSLSLKVGALAELELLTDPSGGRLIRVRGLDQLRAALAQINAEMRNQYLLTYYTDTPPEPGVPPAVAVEVDGLRGLEVRAVLGADQVY